LARATRRREPMSMVKRPSVRSSFGAIHQEIVRSPREIKLRGSSIDLRGSRRFHCSGQPQIQQFAAHCQACRSDIQLDIKNALQAEDHHPRQPATKGLASACHAGHVWAGTRRPSRVNELFQFPGRVAAAVGPGWRRCLASAAPRRGNDDGRSSQAGSCCGDSTG